MNRSTDPSRETQEILDAIRNLVRALRVASSETERKLGLSSAQLFVLQRLGDSAVLSLNELAEKTRTHQSSVSVVVSKLARQGFVTRRQSRKDGRRVEISITRKGAALAERAPETIQERLVAGVEQLAPNRRARLAEGLRAVVVAAGISGEPAPLFFEE